MVDIDTENQEPPSNTNLEQSTNTQSAVYIENTKNEYSNSNYPSYILPQTTNAQSNGNNMGYNSDSDYTNKGSPYDVQSDNSSPTYNVPDNELNDNLANGMIPQYNSQSYTNPSNQDFSTGNSNPNLDSSYPKNSMQDTGNNYDPYNPYSYGSVPISSPSNPTDTTQGYGNTGMGSNQYNYDNYPNSGYLNSNNDYGDTNNNYGSNSGSSMHQLGSGYDMSQGTPSNSQFGNNNLNAGSYGNYASPQTPMSGESYMPITNDTTDNASKYVR